MSENSAIQWTDASWNPWHGCRKVSSGCKYCYMMRDKEKYGQNGTVVLRSKTTFKDPLKWKEPARVFTCSWSDWFIEEADEWRSEAWEIIKKCPHLTFMILTKRPERIAANLPKDWGENGFGYPNVWIGVSVENQKAADYRIPILLSIPARVRFLSCEPLLSKIDLSAWMNTKDVEWREELIGGVTMIGSKIGWVIIGGESGNDQGKWLYRPCELSWIKKIIDQCQDVEVPLFVKQMGTHISKQNGYKNRHGGVIDEWPEELRIREFPKTK